MTLRQQIANELRCELARQGCTQTRMATESGTSLKHLNRVVRGHVGADTRLLDDWAEVLGCEWQIRLRPKRDKGGRLA